MIGVAEMVAMLTLPGATVSDGGVSASEKSGAACDATTVIFSCTECVRLPAVPVKVTLVVPPAAVAAAVKRNACGVPATTDSVVLSTDTPEDGVPHVTVTGPVKPFDAVIEARTVCGLPPAVRLMLVGLRASAKSPEPVVPVPVSESESVALWDNAPLLARKLTGTAAVVVATVSSAASVTVVGVPGVTVIVEGEAVTPAARPLSVTPTVPVKPFNAVAVSVTVPLLPASSDMVVGEMEKEKSGVPPEAAVTVNETVVVSLALPEVPVSVTVLVPTVAVEDAVNVKVAELPTAILALAGESVTPVGKPLAVIVTEPVKLPDAVGVTVNVLLVP